MPRELLRTAVPGHRDRERTMVLRAAFARELAEYRLADAIVIRLDRVVVA